jgi:hypothetical protein
MNKLRIYILALIILLVSQVTAQNVEAYARMDSSSIMIGDQIDLELGITIPENFAVSFPFFKDTITTQIEIINKEPLDTTEVDEGLLIRQLYTITSFDSGYFQLPDFEFMFHHQDDTVLYRTNANTLFLMVNTPVVDTTQAFKVIKGPVSEPYTFMEILPWALLGLAVIGGIIFLVWYIRRRRSKEPVFVRKPKPSLPPDVLALQKLEELRLAKVWQQGKLKEYYTELTDIVRIYCEGRFRFDAMEMTTDEILDELEGHQVNDEAFGKLRAALQLADLAKFAKANPTPLENDLSLNHCVDFVQETKPLVAAEQKKLENPVQKEEG